MSGTITRIGATGAGALLALGIFAAAPSAGASGAHAHGGGHESAACFTATGQTQGRSHSDPDGMSNGGADKPGCPGGFDADKDGNNGCGNDADREDDNNGHCGRKPSEGVASPAPAPTTTTTTTPTTVTVEPTVEVDSGEPTDCQIDPKEADGCPDHIAATAAGSDAGDTTASGTADTEATGQTDEGSSPLAKTGAGVGGIALLSFLFALVRGLLRIG